MPDHQLGTPRDVTDQAPYDVIDRIEDTLLAAPEVAAEAAQVEARKEVRRNWRWTQLAAVLVAVVVSIATSSIAIQVARAAQLDAADAITLGKSAKQTVDEALGKLDTANEQLEQRGQATVKTSPDPDPSEAIQAAVLAQVLARLPAAPTAEQVAAELQPAATAQVVGPSRDTLAQLVSSYFVQNPPGPTPAQIQAAVTAYLQANPPRDGVDGQNGKDGQRGADGVTPPCMSEPAQCRGKDGDKGADSTVLGPVGPPGPPPASWTWPDPVVPGLSHTCTRSDGGSDDAATYSCS